MRASPCANPTVSHHIPGPAFQHSTLLFPLQKSGLGHPARDKTAIDNPSLNLLALFEDIIQKNL
jgi:hypothetical protein